MVQEHSFCLPVHYITYLCGEARQIAQMIFRHSPAQPSPSSASGDLAPVKRPIGTSRGAALDLMAKHRGPLHFPPCPYHSGIAL